VNNAADSFFRPSSGLSPNGFGAGGPDMESAVSGIPVLADEGIRGIVAFDGRGTGTEMPRAPWTAQ
jgi:hypothetical protein